MKTKLTILGAFLALAAFSNAAVLTDPLTLTTSTSNQSSFNLVTPTQGNILTNATVLSDGTVISNDAAPATTNIMDNDQSALSYHHGGGDDGGGVAGKNIITAGVGFVSLTSLLASAYTDAGYAVSSIPVIDVAYERGLSSRWGIGLAFEYTSLSFSLDNQPGYNINTGASYVYDDKLTFSGMGFAVTAFYHFCTSGRIDPFYAVGFGYELFTAKFTTTDPLYGQDDNIEPTTFSAGLPLFNTYFGCRFFITDNIGLYVDAGWHGLIGSVVNLGIAAKF